MTSAEVRLVNLSDRVDGSRVQLTLRTKTALLITSLVLALVGATGWWQYRQLSTAYVKLMREQQQALTERAAADLDYKLAMVAVLFPSRRRSSKRPNARVGWGWRAGADAAVPAAVPAVGDKAWTAIVTVQ